MATGFCMFIVPAFRVPWTWALAAFLIGMIALAYPLLITSRLVRTGNTIMMKRSNAFFLVVIALAAIRYFARGYFDRIMSHRSDRGAVFRLGLRHDPALAPAHAVRIPGTDRADFPRRLTFRTFVAWPVTTRPCALFEPFSGANVGELSIIASRCTV